MPTFSARDGFRASLLEHPKITVCGLQYSIIVICKQENYTIIDKIQPSISRTKIKGTLVINEGGGGGRYSDIFIHTLGSFFGFKILNLTILGGFQKNEYFWGYEDFVDIFGG